MMKIWGSPLPPNYPICEKCQKPVDSVTVETPIASIPGSIELRHTGEIILIVECHGETWSIRRMRYGTEHNPWDEL